MRFLDVLLLLLLLGVLSFSLYVFWQYLPAETLSYEPISAEYSANYSAPIKSRIQFYPEMRFRENRISYKIDSACTEQKEAEIMDAMSILGEKTVLEFYLSSERGEIEILCSDVAPESGQKNHFIAGEGGPTSIINATAYYIILGGKVSLFRPDSCEEPLVALHEILHALGFDHNSNSQSIMYPVTNCKQELDDYIVDAINELYSAPSLPDLALIDAKASKTGRYLAFDVLIANQGLDDANSVVLAVFADDAQIKEFPLYSISIGTRKSLTVENLRIPADANTITFNVLMEKGEAEISLDNNKAVLTLGS